MPSGPSRFRSTSISFTVPFRAGFLLLISSAILLIGIAMIVLPGPAILIIPLGLSILAIEFAWAARWLASVRKTLDGVKSRITRRPSATE